MKCAAVLMSFFLLAGYACSAQSAQSTLEIPGFTAYAEPNPESLQIPESGAVKGWKESSIVLVWYGLIRIPGELDVSVRVSLPKGSKSELQLKAGERVLGQRKIQGSDQPVTVDFGSFPVEKTGAIRFELAGIHKSGKEFGAVEALVLKGSATENALFNRTPERGAPSVHLGYPLPDRAEVQWFYNEVTALKDPLWSYYEACGFARGYFGIQVNSPTERRIIFSVWDSGDEKMDRKNVGAEDRVQLLRKGENVVASDFGNEGTGGHSHMIYNWKTGDTYRFLVSAQPEGNSTIYTAWFYFPEKQSWGLIASFKAPKDGKYLRGLYSFNEDFEGANGQQQRLAQFGNQWVRTTDGKWIELTKARFTHTARGKYYERIDRAAGVTGDRFYLTNGGFEPSTMEYGDMLTRLSSGKMPDIELPEIPDAKTQK